MKAHLILRRLIYSLIFTVLFWNNSTYAIPLFGNYTIDAGSPGSSTNFQSFNAFADSINLNGISGNVLVSVVPGSGPYIEQININTITGSGPNAIVTLDGNHEMLTAVTNTTDRHVIRLSNVSNFNIRNLHIVRDLASTTAFYGIHIYNTGNNINITGCHIEIPGTTSTLTGSIIASGSTTSILTTGDFHDINISNDTTQGGGYGISLFGLLGNLASNIVINNNVVSDFQDNGVYLRETDGAIISNNYFNRGNVGISSANAIQIAQAANINTDIHGNFISLDQQNNGTMSFRGIYLFNGTGHKVYNNVISNISLTSGNFTGIEIRTGSTAPEIYFNTISIDNPLTSSGELFGISEELSNTNSILRNNLISISQPTTNVKAALALGAISTVTSAFNSNYNLLYVPNGNVAIKNALTPTLYSSLSNWQGASGMDLNSLSLDPLFLSISSPVPTNAAMDDAGISIPWITTDVLGTNRGPNPDIGAYEFLSASVNEFSNSHLLHCYPNPAVSHLIVELPELISKSTSISIYNIHGELIQEKAEYAINDKSIIIQTSLLSSGLYLVRIEDEHNSYEERFIKQK